ncbi:hypothetical protein [Streptomyces sp. NPDC015414]|uniref:hypothetical protein n=1 Tax=Streptomyces sp. NPDC015414 TaxID=3364957 RepID=UPI0036FE1FA0
MSPSTTSSVTCTGGTRPRRRLDPLRPDRPRGPAPGRHDLRIALLTPDAEIPLSMARWDAAVYDDAAEAAHLTSPAWALPTVPGEERTRRPHGYWDTAQSNPFPAGLTTTRPL